MLVVEEEEEEDDDEDGPPPGALSPPPPLLCWCGYNLSGVELDEEEGCLGPPPPPPPLLPPPPPFFSGTLSFLALGLNSVMTTVKSLTVTL